ncbi:MAG: hypothetical protein E7667_05850 [Ruminococcaceae bacterium]|nr:hypothetical protein [Oscillospiraceae bacterium]
MKFQNNPPQKRPQKQLSEKAKKEMLRIIGYTLLAMFVYFGASAVPIPAVGYAVVGIYMTALAVFAVVYICYNYAFTRKDVTVDMLPDDWSEEQKLEYVEKPKQHFAKSRWMIFVIFPLIITFIADVLYLFVWTGFLEGLFIR